MKQLQQNFFLVGLILAAVILVGGLGYFAFHAYNLYSEELENYEKQVKTLHRLQNNTPYPSGENLAALQQSIAEYQTQLVTLDTALLQQQPRLPELTPNQFQDTLRAEVSAVEEKAAKEKVTLPANFYLGFNEFKDGLPTPVTAPFLARQLGVLRWLADTLIDSGIKSIDLWKRLPLPVENDAALAKFPETPSPENLVRSSTLIFAITGEQTRVRRALNDLFKSPQFLVIRTLEILNSAPAAPTKEATVNPSTPTTTLRDLFGQEANRNQTGPDLPIVLGREVVTARVRLELLDFAPLAAQP